MRSDASNDIGRFTRPRQRLCRGHLRGRAAIARLVATGVLLLSAMTTHAAAEPVEDPYLWLEDIASERALDWVRLRNAAAEKELTADPRYEPLRQSLLRILDSRDRIPLVTRMGGHYYNFWRDAANPRGLWRRVAIADYAQASPPWETVLDLDALARAEKENWVWKSPTCLRPDRAGEPYRHCMLALSRGGADATVRREFDLIDRRFVENGFRLPEAKQNLSWKDADTLWVATDLGPDSMTTSGYPRTAREWKRGTPVATAPIVFEGRKTDVDVAAFSERESGVRRDWVERSIAFWNDERFVAVDGRLVRLEIPNDAEQIPFADWLLVRTRTPWSVQSRTYPAGALLAIRFDAFMRGDRSFDVLYEAGPRSSLDDVSTSRSAVLITELDNVRSRLWELRHDGRVWQRTRVPMPENSQIDVAMSSWESDDYLIRVQNFVTPTELLARTVGGPAPVVVKSLPSYFDAAGLEIRQYEARSKDGTQVPYFVVLRRDLKLDGSHPTLLTGYGGFAIPELPRYSGVFGKGWLEPGGVLVVANLRGGGEFGPEWHRAAQKENKQRTWDDMAAVAEDLIRRGITSPSRLGIMGGSQGGLLVTATMWQRPELFGAVVSQVPLVDMLRYHKLLAGASWIAEYGDPDKPEERAVIARYSPYQNVRRGQKYPRLFLVTSTRDDRVHPGHARKMAARMTEQGHDVVYFENIEGGHGAAADNEQAARMWAQTFTFLWRQLGRP
jgi:prolyl oligopeptidase